MLRVTLLWYEMQQAASVGVSRQVESLRKGLKDAHGFTGSGWDCHIEGAAGELAFAKAMGFYFSGSVNEFGKADIGTRIQVRTRSSHTNDLIVRDGDKDDDIFVLVTGKAPDFLVQGWTHGKTAKQAKYKKSHGGRAEAYFVPQYALRPFPGSDEEFMRAVGG